MADLQFNNVLVIGAGTMGAGIAQWFAQQACHVDLVDINQELAKNSLERIHSSWERLLEKGKFTTTQVNSFKACLKVEAMESVGATYDLVVEAIIENLDIKKQLFATLDERLDQKTIFASNTSSLPIEKIAEDLPVERQQSFLGLHFFNPAPIMKLVEVISSKWTNESTANALFSWFEGKGKKPAHCKDRPGFIVNRVARNFYGEALRIAEEENLERIKEIDHVLNQVGGFKMGPFTLMDLIGIDINLDVTKSVWEAFGKEPRFAPHKLQQLMVDQGRFGKKTKKGFYSYE